jgi:hypothetical protein
MESNMVNNWANHNCCIVEDFLKRNFPQIRILKKYAQSPYWNILLEYEYIKVKTDGDIGFSIDILIEDSKYPLCQHDRSVDNKMETTKENILYQLSVLKRFLDDVGLMCEQKTLLNK